MLSVNNYASFSHREQKVSFQINKQVLKLNAASGNKEGIAFTQLQVCATFAGTDRFTIITK